MINSLIQLSNLLQSNVCFFLPATQLAHVLDQTIVMGEDTCFEYPNALVLIKLHESKLV